MRHATYAYHVIGYHVPTRCYLLHHYTYISLYLYLSLSLSLYIYIYILHHYIYIYIYYYYYYYCYFYYYYTYYTYYSEDRARLVASLPPPNDDAGPHVHECMCVKAVSETLVQRRLHPFRTLCTVSHAHLRTHVRCALSFVRMHRHPRMNVVV